jgi:hypothetical protein
MLHGLFLLTLSHSKKRLLQGLTNEDGNLLHPERRKQSQEAPPPKNTVVLGREVLEEIWIDQARTQLPSFVTAAPLVAAEKRTPTADHWRSIGLIHLVITLIRLWGHKEGRLQEMLHNYMHLVTAIHITNMRSMSKEKIDLYSFHYEEYFCGILKLYKEARIRPVHHMAFHYQMLLEAFGPVHSWRAWAFERFNYTLQTIKTNSKFGEQRLLDLSFTGLNSPMLQVRWK